MTAGSRNGLSSRPIGQLEPAVIGLDVVRREPTLLPVPNLKARVVHAERAEDAFVEERVEGGSGPDFDEAAEHVGRHAVVPARARLEDQGLGGGGFHDVGERPHAGVELDAARAIQRIDGVLVLEPVGESRGMNHEVVHGDGTRERYRCE